MWLFYTRSEVITEWRPIQFSLLHWGEQISGCSLPSSLCESLSLPLYPLSMLSFLCQWWVSDFGIYESANAHAGGSVTNVAVCWASHALIVHFQGCAYTQWITRLCVCVSVWVWCCCRSVQMLQGLLKHPILLKQGSLFFLKSNFTRKPLVFQSETHWLEMCFWSHEVNNRVLAIMWRFEMFWLWWIMS